MPLTKLDHLLASFKEEEGEIVQAAGKAIKFGVFDINPNGSNLTNFDYIKLEVHDNLAVYQMICAELKFPDKISPALLANKKARVLKWMEYAKSRGRL